MVPLIVLPAALPPAPQAADRQPNVVIILADDMGYGDVSAYGQTSVQTSNIDRLARGGVCFTDGHATSATSTPSRYGLFTGMFSLCQKPSTLRTTFPPSSAVAKSPARR